MAGQNELKLAQKRLAAAKKAIEHLQVCKSQATVDADLLDPVIFGAHRIAFYYQRMLDLAHIDELARAWPSKASPLKGDAKAEGPGNYVSKVDEVIGIVKRWQDTYAQMRSQWQQLWLRENKPYALDWSLRRYDEAIERCRRWLVKLTEVRAAAAAGRAEPSLYDVGLGLWRWPVRMPRPARIRSSLGNYRSYYREFAFDGAPHTFYWSDRGLKEGDFFTLEFNEPVPAKRLTILMGTDRFRSEYIHAGTLEVRYHKRDWQPVAPLDEQVERINLSGEPVRAIRLRVNKPQHWWLIIREIVVE